MTYRFNKNLLDDEDQEEFYRFVNKVQKKYTQNINCTEQIDLFIVLDISGSMAGTCNIFINCINTAAGYLMNGKDGGALDTGTLLIQSKKSRLQEAKRHLIIQIRLLIKQKRINKLGLITFNHQSIVTCPLTDNFDKIISQIQRQKAHGRTALYDSLKYAAKQLKDSKNPRLLIMTDGQDNCSKEKDICWLKEWFGKDGLKSTFFTICQGNNQGNRQLANTLKSKYLLLGEQCFFSNELKDEQMWVGMNNLK